VLEREIRPAALRNIIDCAAGVVRDMQSLADGIACSTGKEMMMNMHDIREHMPVIAPCGRRIGTWIGSKAPPLK
jgi:hypothetical protein